MDPSLHEYELTIPYPSEDPEWLERSLENLKAATYPVINNEHFDTESRVQELKPGQ